MIRDALAALRARRGRTLLAAIGVLAASLVVGTATTVGYSLATGFDRAADEADLPDVLARFTRDERELVDSRVSALPNLQARSYRRERLNQLLRAGSQRTRKGAVTALLGGRRGYLIVDGRDLRDDEIGDVVIERGLAREWDLQVGDTLDVGDPNANRDREIYFGPLRIVGIAVSPDNVAYPAGERRARLRHRGRVSQRGGIPDRVRIRPDTALLWLNDPSKADVTLTQARAVAFGLGELQFITRTGVKILLSQAAGIVISLLVAFSLVALVAAGTMLAASAHAEVQRRLTGFGVQRALGFGPGRIAAAAGGRGGGRRGARGRGRHRARRARRRAPRRRPARRAQRARPGPGARAAAAPRAARRRRRGRVRGDLAGVARRTPPAGRDPPRRRPRPPPLC